jgi:antitoxin MazE
MSDIRRTMKLGEIKIGKWGNSAAVRLSAKTMKRLGLAEGDLIDESSISLTKVEEVNARARRTAEAIEEIRKMRVPLPPGYKFDREEANARGPD